MSLSGGGLIALSLARFTLGLALSAARVRCVQCSQAGPRARCVSSIVSRGMLGPHWTPVLGGTAVSYSCATEATSEAVL